jgi:hypothetical protein
MLKHQAVAPAIDFFDAFDCEATKEVRSSSTETIHSLKPRPLFEWLQDRWQKQSDVLERLLEDQSTPQMPGLKIFGSRKSRCDIHSGTCWTN